ncbi:unnamed protein product [Rotaria magnacalcarata]|nr:unnamed protein product [Rotaria magnacalcarata]CAF4182669.1 unnamed protein product [Rotaria magnacalcarata]
MASKILSLSKLEGAPIGCHKITPTILESNGKDIKEFDMGTVSKFISLPIRPHRPFYFFAAFVYPMLPLDFIGNKSEIWDRIYACFTHVMNSKKIVSRSEQIATKYAMTFVEELKLRQSQKLEISDKRLRDIICAIMWELVFESEPTESDLKNIIELTQSISSAITYNCEPNWSQRIASCLSFLKQIQSNPEVQLLQKDYKLTNQEICTVFTMELFVTPALEIGEVMANLMKVLVAHNADLVEKVSYDSDLMRYAIIATAHRYPVLQVIMREVPNADNNKHLTKCINLISDVHVAEIQTQIVAECHGSKSVIDDINHYISIKNYDESSISEIDTCMAFGRGQRICKGKELAIKTITSFLTTVYKELHQWPDVEISAGRKYTAFNSFDHRLYYWYRRWLIANVHYHCDKLFRRSELHRFQCHI